MTSTQWARTMGSAAISARGLDLHTTLRAARNARSLFLRRELRRAISHHGCDTALGVLMLGGTGSELLQCAEEHRESELLDLLLVSDECDPEVVAESVAWPLDTAVRIGVRRYSPVEYLLDDDATAARPRDIVLLDSVLDSIDDATASRVLTAALERVRRGGTVVAPTFDAGLAAESGARAREYGSVADMVAAISRSDFRAGILERGPNRWIVLERT